MTQARSRQRRILTHLCFIRNSNAWKRIADPLLLVCRYSYSRRSAIFHRGFVPAGFAELEIGTRQPAEPGTFSTRRGSPAAPDALATRRVEVRTISLYPAQPHFGILHLFFFYFFYWLVFLVTPVPPHPAAPRVFPSPPTDTAQQM